MKTRQRHMKRMTYHNLMVVIHKLQAKGWNFEEAESMARNYFAEFEACPMGMSIEERIRRQPTREEWEGYCREIQERGW